MIDEVNQIKKWIKNRFGRLENIPNKNYKIPINGKMYTVTIKNDTIMNIKKA